MQKLLLSVTVTLILISCSDKINKRDFIGHYIVYNAQALDSTIKTLEGWSLDLEDKNNFVITGPDKKLVGYWDIAILEDNRYQLLLQGGGQVQYGVIADKNISFDRPHPMFDSLFRIVTFRRQ